MAHDVTAHIGMQSFCFHNAVFDNHAALLKHIAISACMRDCDFSFKRKVVAHGTSRTMPCRCSTTRESLDHLNLSGKRC